MKVTEGLGFKDAILRMATMHHVCVNSSWQDIKSPIQITSNRRSNELCCTVESAIIPNSAVHSERNEKEQYYRLNQDWSKNRSKACHKIGYSHTAAKL